MARKADDPAMFAPTLKIALKEWAVVCQALETGRQMILLRKGGIVEAIGGFELEQSRFLLFPTYLHQNATMLKSEARVGLLASDAEPEQITISGAAEVTDIIQLKNRTQMEALDAKHIWAPPLIDMRFNYRPKNPLYLLIVRTYSLSNAVAVKNTQEYAGCKSWVSLAESIDCSDLTPAIDDEQFIQNREQIRSLVDSKSGWSGL
jgi:hypothetical protein